MCWDESYQCDTTDCPDWINGCMDTYANNYNENANHDCSGQIDITEDWYNFNCCQYNPPTGNCQCQCNCGNSMHWNVISGPQWDCMSEDHCESTCTFTCDNYYDYCNLDWNPEGWVYMWSQCSGLGRGETTKSKLSDIQLQSMSVEQLKRIKNNLK